MTSNEGGGARVQPPDKPLVTLFEAYGSGAGYVGRRVAERLGVPFFDQTYASGAVPLATTVNEAG